jgi:DNA-binding CsgD family transcriptional regulator
VAGSAVGAALVGAYTLIPDGLGTLLGELGDLRAGLSDLRAAIESWRAEWALGGPLGTHALLREITGRLERLEGGLGGDTLGSGGASGPPSDGGARQRPEVGSGADAITPREREVLRLLAGGAGNMAIAEALVISPLTVKTYVGKLRTKLRAENRLGAVARARELGLLE